MKKIIIVLVIVVLLVGNMMFIGFLGVKEDAFNEVVKLVRAVEKERDKNLKNVQVLRRAFDECQAQREKERTEAKRPRECYAPVTNKEIKRRLAQCDQMSQDVKYIHKIVRRVKDRYGTEFLIRK